MTSTGNRPAWPSSRGRRVCATIMLAILMTPLTGCSSNDFFFVLFLSLACGTSFANPVVCDDLRLQTAEDQFQACRRISCDSECDLRQQVLEIASETCSDQQQQAQSAIMPGSTQPQCTTDYVTQQALDDEIACDPRVNQQP